jgi:hypothetical protein
MSIRLRRRLPEGPRLPPSKREPGIDPHDERGPKDVSDLAAQNRLAKDEIHIVKATLPGAPFAQTMVATKFVAPPTMVHKANEIGPDGGGTISLAEVGENSQEQCGPAMSFQQGRTWRASPRRS